MAAATAVTARESHSATVKAVVIEQQARTVSVARSTCPNTTTRTKRHSSSTSQ